MEEINKLNFVQTQDEICMEIFKHLQKSQEYAKLFSAIQEKQGYEIEWTRLLTIEYLTSNKSKGIIIIGKSSRNHFQVESNITLNGKKGKSLTIQDVLNEILDDDSSLSDSTCHIVALFISQIITLTSDEDIYITYKPLIE